MDFPIFDIQHSTILMLALLELRSLSGDLLSEAQYVHTSVRDPLYTFIRSLGSRVNVTFQRTSS